jgi:hypothetical protein
MCAMSPRLLRPIASGIHPEAAAWRSAVIANGGSVSGSTLKAVTDFCRRIDAAGIRDRFYRLNLFCGTSDASLVAPRVPLYRGPSLGGTQYGNALDTNNNFVQGDYAETGASGGILGASSKYLNTGLKPDDMPSVATGHLSHWRDDSVEAGSFTRITIGAQSATNIFRMDERSSGQFGFWGGSSGAAGVSEATANAEGHKLVSRLSATDLTLYQNGSSVATNTSSATPGSHEFEWYVFTSNASGAASTSWIIFRLRMYSIGLDLDGSQAAAFYTALNSFMQALGRA